MSDMSAVRIAIVGAGPAGLSTAIRLKQLAQEKGHEVSVVVLEKGSEPGAHILSGAIMDPRALTELFPDWKALGAPLNQPVTEDAFLFLSETGAMRTPNFLLPKNFHNDGNYIISLANLTRWLAQQAEVLLQLGFEGVVEHGVLLFQGAKGQSRSLGVPALVVQGMGNSLGATHTGPGPACAALNALLGRA